MENANNVWLIPCSPKHFDAEGCFSKYGQIYWKQEGNLKKAQVGDTGFIYCSAPIKAILYSIEITETDIPYSHALDVEDEFSLDGKYNRDNSESKFLIVKITGETHSQELTFENLLQNGLNGSVMCSMRISNMKYEGLLHHIYNNF